MDTRELIRCSQQGLSIRRIAMITGRSRVTVRRYLAAARVLGLEPGGPDPTEVQLSPLTTHNLTAVSRPGTPAQDRLASPAGQIESWFKEEKLQLVRILELLADHGCQVSYTSLRRFVAERGLKQTAPTATVRMAERKPGEAAEMDFARLGSIFDSETGRKRSVWALVVVLPYSRHGFVWPLLRQRIEEVIDGREQALRVLRLGSWFLVLDNIPAAPHPRIYSTTPSTAALSATRKGCENLRTNRTWSATWPTCASPSSRGLNLPGWKTCDSGRPSGAGRWPAGGCMEPPRPISPWSSSCRKSGRA